MNNLLRCPHTCGVHWVPGRGLMVWVREIASKMIRRGKKRELADPIGQPSGSTVPVACIWKIRRAMPGAKRRLVERGDKPPNFRVSGRKRINARWRCDTVKNQKVSRARRYASPIDRQAGPCQHWVDPKNGAALSQIEAPKIILYRFTPFRVSVNACRVAC